MLRSKLSLRVRPQMKKQPANKKLNCTALGSQQTQRKFQESMTALLGAPLAPGIEEGWKSLSTAAAAAAAADKKNVCIHNSNIFGFVYGNL